MISRRQRAAARVSLGRKWVESRRQYRLQHLVGSLEVVDQHAHLGIISRPLLEGLHLPLHALHSG
jgi:hypothetical protein